MKTQRMEKGMAGRNLDRMLHAVLVTGLALSTSTICVGILLSVLRHEPISSHVLNYAEIWVGLQRGTTASILNLGILLLIATPILRVCGSLMEFIVIRDWRYTGVTLLVLLILAVSVISGLG